MIESIKAFLKQNVKESAAVGVLVLLIILGVSFGGGYILPEANAEQEYVLVPDNVSQSAPLFIKAPKGVSSSDFKKEAISFTPEIPGSWVDDPKGDALVYKPSSKLEIGKHYQVALSVGENKSIRREFLVAEDPRVDAVFPKKDTEADEHSSITIIFNRPMVTLTTRDTLEQTEIPITITPPTPGKWKWITTRNLQFIPETSLSASAHYTVKLTSALVSVEGLPVKTFTHTFTTRPLRFLGSTSGDHPFNTPIILSFNQPVNLEKTTSEITVTGPHGAIPVTVQYGSARVYDALTRKTNTYVDRSQLEIIQSVDSHGRKNMWDFETNYQLSLARAYPLSGDINYTHKQSTFINVPPIVSGVTATSDRTSDSSVDRFDPKGKITVSFYEKIDLAKTSFNAKGLSGVAYGQMCAPGEEYRSLKDCTKVDNKQSAVLTFNDGAFRKGERFVLSISHITNEDGVVANDKPLEYGITTYPEFKVLKTLPVSGGTSASLTELALCTNTPLASKDKSNYKESIKADKYLVFSNWPESYFLAQSDPAYNKCPVGTFETVVRYGLLPDTNYTLNLSLSDVFGQSAKTDLKFKTKSADQINYRIQNMQKVYNVTTPAKTKLTYATENLEYVNVSICKIAPVTLLDELGGYIAPTTPLNTGNCLALKQDTIQLPKRYFVNNYFQIDLKKYFPEVSGQYEVVLTHPKFRQVGYDNTVGPQLYDRAFVSVSNLAVVEKHIAWRDEYYNQSVANRGKLQKIPEGLIWVSRTGTLDGVAGANVSIYSRTEQTWSPEGEVPRGPMTLAGSTKTDAQGVARPTSVKNFYGAIVTSGTDAAVVSSWSDSLSGYRANAEKAARTYLYTDRPMYRPSHEVFVRGIDRAGYDGNYESLAGKTVPVKVYDSQGVLIYSADRPIGEFGTFNFSFKLKDKAPLGMYRIDAFNGYGYGSFEVLEYVPAAFETVATTDKDEYVANDTAHISLDSKYYFGVPVDGGEVNYTITSQDYYFDRYTDQYFNFGAGWYDCYQCGFGDHFITRGTATLDGSGHADISQSLDFKKLFTGDAATVSKIFVIDATVKDRNGRSVSVQKSFIVHRGSVYVGVRTDDYFIHKGERATYKIKTVDTNGAPVARSGITATLNKVTWAEYKRQELDGGYYYRTDRQLEKVATDIISTDSRGDGAGSFLIPKEGEYEISVSATDDKGNRVESKTSIYVSGDENVDVRSTNNVTLDISANRTKVNPGDTAQFVIKSPYPRAKALISVERGSIISYDIVDVTSSLFGYSFPVTSAHVPNVSTSVVLLSPNPEVKYGEVNFSVGTDLKKLGVSVTSNKKNYLPGETVTLDIKTTNPSGAGVPAEISLSVVDLSVLALSGNQKKNPLVFFYDGFPVTVMTESNVKNILYELDVPLGTKGGGGGGGEAEDLAKRQRGDFRDTAFWNASVVTDASGHAQVTFRLPDNLTTWQIESVGVTKDTLLGVDYRTLMARKDVMLVPLKPRFLVPGDQFSLGAKVFNQTDVPQRFSVSLSSKTLTVKDSFTKSVTVAPGKNESVFFSVVAPENKKDGAHEFVLKAVSGNFEDSVRNEIAITPNDTYESTATAGYSKSDTVSEYLYVPKEVIADKGDLTVRAQATIAVFMTDALKYMATYPYGCSEQMASKLAAIAVATRAAGTVKDTNSWKPTTVTFEGKSYTVNEAVKVGIDRLAANQRSDGGFVYYPEMPKSDFYLTLSVVEALSALKKAGFAIDESSLSRASIYVVNTVTTEKYLRESPEAIISAAYALRDTPQAGNSFFSSSLARFAGNSGYLNENSSSQTLAQLAYLSATIYPNLVSKVFSALENRIQIDSRGAYLGTNDKDNYILWRWYETPTKDTALALKAISARRVDNAILDKLVRYLVASRAKDGSWDSTSTTLTALDAMTDYMLWQKENQANFSLKTTLGEKSLGTLDITPATIFKTFQSVVPMKNITKGELTPLVLTKTNRGPSTNLYYDATLKYYLPADKIPARDEGFSASRALYSPLDKSFSTALSEAKVGDVLRGRIQITVPRERDFVSVEDFIPAGFELVNFDLATEDKTLLQDEKNPENYPNVMQPEVDIVPLPAGALDQGNQPNAPVSTYIPSAPARTGVAATLEGIFGWGGGAKNAQTSSFVNRTGKYLDELLSAPRTDVLPVSSREIHDDRLFLFVDHLSPGVYTYDYFVRALVPGTFQHLPARVEAMYAPEIFGRSGGAYFTVRGE